MNALGSTRRWATLLCVVLASCLITNCDSDPGSDEESNITAQWHSKGTMTLSYSHGVLSGSTCYAQFDVLEGSGTLKVTVSFKNPSTGDTKSGTVEVEKGETIKVSSAIGFGGRKYGCSPGSEAKIEFKSSSMSTPFSFSSPTAFDELQGWYCMTPSSIGALTFTKM